jgi:hypothetical protein
MGDGEQRGAAGSDAVEQQVQDAALVGRVQVAGGLVGEQQAGLWQQRPADGDALALALGEVTRVARELLSPTPRSSASRCARVRTVRSRRSASLMR